MTYKYKRGESYCVTITVDKYDMLTFSDATFPVGTTQEIKLKFFEEAERAALTQLEKHYNQWNTMMAGGD